jgi:peptidase C39-like protein
LLPLLLALALAQSAGAVPAAGHSMLAVPYLSQTEALCGGAATAMVFRFWGDRHAGVQQFEPLVDRRSGGIADTVLIDTIRRAGWNAARIDASVPTIREHIEAGHPLILLIEDRPSRYHYVVAVGIDDTHVFLHDPTWGPSRRLEISRFLRVWEPTHSWTLLVTPTERIARTIAKAAEPINTVRATEPTACDRLLDTALDAIAAKGAGVADEVLGDVHRQCPTSSGPLRELAGIRFSEQRWADAAALSRQALSLDANDRYAWDVLGSSRFLQNDAHGALRAWNRIDKPTLDSVQIAGLKRTRYALVAQMAALTPNTLLTDRQLRLAERRLQQLPGRQTSSVTYRNGPDDFATVNVAIAERAPWPRGLVDWTAIGGESLINRETTLVIPGGTGQGEVWSANWRWWADRPRIGVSFSAPRTGRFGGVWRVDGWWEAETYAGATPEPPVRQQRLHGGFSMANWVTPDLRYEGTVGLDAWDQEPAAPWIGGLLDRRFVFDHVSLSGGATYWFPVKGGSSFATATVRGWYRSSTSASGFVALANARADIASERSPLSVWQGAGEGRARPALLRAHGLLNGGIIDGPVFGRRVASGTMEVQRWLNRPAMPRIGVAVFTDMANAVKRLTSFGRPFQVDVGAGFRLRLPGNDNTIRLDYARGLRDRGAQALTIGWSPY